MFLSADISYQLTPHGPLSYWVVTDGFRLSKNLKRIRRTTHEVNLYYYASY